MAEGHRIGIDHRPVVGNSVTLLAFHKMAQNRIHATPGRPVVLIDATGTRAQGPKPSACLVKMRNSCVPFHCRDAVHAFGNSLRH